MQWGTIPDRWIWIRAAGVFAVFVGAFAGYSFYKPKPTERTKSNAAAQNGGWTATGESIL
jgi:hypothetical protein